MKNPITFKVFHTDNYTQVQIHGDHEYSHSLYLDADGLAPLTTWRKLVMDGNTVVLLEPARIVLIESPARCGSFGTPGDGEAQSRAFIYHLDTQKFLAALRTLRTKRLGPTIELAAFKFPKHVTPRLTSQAIMRHPNARDGVSRTMLQFRRELPPPKWHRFMEVVSDYVGRAVLYGHDREFYFDGRKLPNGLGFNGGIILREADFSIHT